MPLFSGFVNELLSRRINLPYIQGLSEQLQGTLSQHNIKSTFYTTTTLHNILPSPKDPVPTEKKHNIIYKLDCKDCERIGEHISAVRKADTKWYETADHCWKFNHDFNWTENKISGHELNTTTRKIKETIHSIQTENCINGISYKLPDIWLPAINVKHDGNIPFDCFRFFFSWLVVVFVLLFKMPLFSGFVNELLSRRINLPYIQGLSEQLQGTLSQHNIKSTFYTTTTLHNILPSPKDPVPTEKKHNIIYKLDCKDCERIGEHISAVRKADTKRYETADHCWKFNHDFNWTENKILGHELNTTTRKIKETIHSIQTENCINGISYKLPDIWLPAINVKHDGNIPFDCFRFFFSWLVVVFVLLFKMPLFSGFVNELLSRRINLPYIQGLSEQLQGTLSQHNIKSTFYTTTTLHNILPSPKDPVPTEKKHNIIYKLDCKDCERIGEHISAVRKADTKRYETADHCWKFNHDFNWTENKILGHELNTTTRKIKETIHSIQTETCINGISYKLPDIWLPAINVKHDGNIQTENNCQKSPNRVH